MMMTMMMHSDLGTMPRFVDILFFGDMVGKAGREAIYHYLAHHVSSEDETATDTVIIGNVENCTHGFGIAEKHYHELLNKGFHALTGGNHSFDRKETADYIASAHAMVRPANLPGNVPGQGARLIEAFGVKIGILNILGQSYMGNYNSPLEAMEDYLPQLLAETPIVFVDIHAESTAEKTVLAMIAAEMGVSAMAGTHTHVQTADERLLNGRCGYITDAGFNGSRNSVIGMDVYSSMARMKQLGHVKLEVSALPLVQVNAVRFTIEVSSGCCAGVKRIHEVFELPAHVKLS
jgi:2',3'-cyclic-nucleotide 2'-phosphodiesterase